MTSAPHPNIGIIGRIYFAAVLPFFGAAAGPWLLGSFQGREVPVFLLWSFTVLTFTAAGFLGAQSLAPTRLLKAHLAVALGLVAVGLLTVLFAESGLGLFAATLILLLLQWLNLAWMQKTSLWARLSVDWAKQHHRFVWVVVACHMLVAFNQLEVIRRASMPA